MKIPENKAAVNKAWDELEKLPACDEKKLTSKSEVVRQAKKDGRTVSLREPDGSLSLEER